MCLLMVCAGSGCILPVFLLPGMMLLAGFAISGFIIFAGQGNNGADALAIARLLTEESYRVETYLFNPTEHLSPDCEANKRRLLLMDRVEFTEVIEDFTPPVLTEHDIVIDGLFGSGLNRPLTGGFAAVVDYINKSDAHVVSIDIPSGLFGEDNRGNDREAIVKANLTLTFEFPKLAFFLAENAPYVGEWKTLEIGLHPDVIERTETPYTMVTEEDISYVIQPRDRFAHKGTFGHALLIAGSKGKMGAAILAAKILATSDPELLKKVKDYAVSLKEQVQAKDARLQEVGYREYMKK